MRFAEETRGSLSLLQGPGQTKASTALHTAAVLESKPRTGGERILMLTNYLHICRQLVRTGKLQVGSAFESDLTFLNHVGQSGVHWNNCFN